LVYLQQSGAINESFSDMAGEATEYYFVQKFGKPFTRPVPDMQVGADIVKQAGTALRYMCNPPQDGNSIGNANDYHDGLDVHYASGVFNKAFCLLSQRNGWNVKMAFDVFVVANQHFWVPNSTFQTAAAGALEAAAVLNYPTADVIYAFSQVGIDLTSAQRYFYNTLRVITNSSPRGCGVSNWNCMTNLCKADLNDQSAWRGWAGCWQKGGTYICYFECSQFKQFF
jgi:hypothetical protein